MNNITTWFLSRMDFLLNTKPHYVKTWFAYAKNKGAYQLCSDHTDDQCLCFCYIDSRIPLLPKFEILGIKPSPEAIQIGLCRTWSETLKTDFLGSKLILKGFLPNFIIIQVFDALSLDVLSLYFSV